MASCVEIMSMSEARCSCATTVVCCTVDDLLAHCTWFELQLVHRLELVAMKAIARDDQAKGTELLLVPGVAGVVSTLSETSDCHMAVHACTHCQLPLPNACMHAHIECAIATARHLTVTTAIAGDWQCHTRSA
jgi:hypothetical protein